MVILKEEGWVEQLRTDFLLLARRAQTSHRFSIHLRSLGILGMAIMLTGLGFRDLGFRDLGI